MPLLSAGEARPLHIPMVMPCCFVTVRGRVLSIDLRNPVSSTPYRFDHHLDLFGAVFGASQELLKLACSAAR